jgi:carbamoyl-phosphate synthase large subunit
MAAQPPLPTGGNVFLSVKDADKINIVRLGKELVDLGFTIYATNGTAAALTAAGLAVHRLFKLSEGRPHVIDMMKNDEIALIINTPAGKTPRKDEVKIRSTAVERRIPILTTISGVEASIWAMRSIQTKGLTVKSLQEYHLAS